MKILVTGAAGFIGYHFCKLLIEEGFDVVGLDSINDYYDVNLKFGRLKNLGIDKKNASTFNLISINKNFKFIRANIEDMSTIDSLFSTEKFDIVCNLAAQVGVRSSLNNPNQYIDTNIKGFLNILECCKINDISHLIYASSSSVYGLNKKIPFSVNDNVDNPISLYAATKKSNELMAHTYSHLYNFPTTGLRFFTVYGPWGRPDMALFLFTKGIIEGKPINVYNRGNMLRDFTFIDDVVKGLFKIVTSKSKKLFNIYNFGNNNSVSLSEFIFCIEQRLGKSANKVMLPMQPGDIHKTLANVDNLIKDFNYTPSTSIVDGVNHFIDWYVSYYNVEI